jgi:RHS repeat-associated protein
VSVGGTLASSYLTLPSAVAATDISYDSANELTKFGGSTNTYDADGNVQYDGTNNYVWDARNQLSSMTGGSTLNFKYDAFGRRTKNALARTLLYDGDDAVEEFSGTAPQAGRIVGGTDEFFQRDTTSGSYYPLVDGVGSIVALTTSTGAIGAQYIYDPFGVTSATGSTIDNSFKFTGREFDGTSLYYFRTRYYKPKFDRFISEDSFRFRAGSNFYSYVKNKPEDDRDPFGLDAIDVGKLWQGVKNGAWSVYNRANTIASFVTCYTEYYGCVVPLVENSQSIGQAQGGAIPVYTPNDLQNPDASEGHRQCHMAGAGNPNCSNVLASCVSAITPGVNTLPPLP